MGALEALSTTPLEVDQFLYRFERAALYEFLSSAPARSATRSALRDLKMVPALELDREKLAADLFRAALRGAPEPGSKTIAVIESEGLPRFAACRLDVGQTLASLRMWPAPEGTGPRGPTIDLLVLVSDEEWCPQPAMQRRLARSSAC